MEPLLGRRMVSIQCLTHGISHLWDLDAFLSPYPKSLPSPLPVQPLKVQFKFKFKVPDHSYSMPSVCSEFLLYYSLYSLAFSPTLSYRTGCHVYTTYTEKHCSSAMSSLMYTSQLNKSEFVLETVRNRGKYITLFLPPIHLGKLQS